MNGPDARRTLAGHELARARPAAKGSPSGGQFAPSGRAESGVELAAPAPPPSHAFDYRPRPKMFDPLPERPPDWGGRVWVEYENGILEVGRAGRES